MPKIVRIKDGLNHGRRDREASMKHGGEIYVATDDELRSFGDKFVVLDDAQEADLIASTTIDKVIALAEGDVEKATYLVAVESSGKQRTTLVDRLNKIAKGVQE